jgi:hypothetical protein
MATQYTQKQLLDAAFSRLKTWTNVQMPSYTLRLAILIYKLRG